MLCRSSKISTNRNRVTAKKSKSRVIHAPISSPKRCIAHPQTSSTRKTSKPPAPSISNMIVQHWPLDSSILPITRQSLDNPVSILYRPAFPTDTISSKLAHIGEVSLPFKTSLDGSFVHLLNQRRIPPQHLKLFFPSHILAMILCSAIIRGKIISQTDQQAIQAFYSESKSISICKKVSSQIHHNFSSTSDSISSQRDNNNTNHSLDFSELPTNLSTLFSTSFSPLSTESYLDLYHHQLGYDNTSSSSESLSTPASSSPLPSFVVQGSFSNLKTLNQSIKTHIEFFYSPSASTLARIYDIPIESIQNNPALNGFLLNRHINSLSSLVTSRLLIATDSSYNPIHLSQLPVHTPVHPTHDLSPSSKSANIYLSDMISSCVEQHLPSFSSSSTTTFLPRRSYGIPLPSSQTERLRAVDLSSWQIHFGSHESPRPHPSQPGKTIRTVSPLVSTLLQLHLSYLFPATFIFGIIASQSSHQLLLPNTTSLLDKAIDSILQSYHKDRGPRVMFGLQNDPMITRLLPPFLREYKAIRDQNHSQYHDTDQLSQFIPISSSYGVFSPTRVDYLDAIHRYMAETVFRLSQETSQISRSYNILDMGCGSGILSGLFVDTVLSTFPLKSNTWHIDAVDINPRAVTSTQQVIHTLLDQRSKLQSASFTHSVQLSQLFSAFGPNSNPTSTSSTQGWDIIMFNPPWIPLVTRSGAGASTQSDTTPQPTPTDSNSNTTSHATNMHSQLTSPATSLDAAVFDQHFETLQAFLQQCKSHLFSVKHVHKQLMEHHVNPQHHNVPRSEVWIILSSLFGQLNLDSMLNSTSIPPDPAPSKHMASKKHSLSKSRSKQVMDTLPFSEKLGRFLEQQSGLTLSQTFIATSHNASPSHTQQSNSISIQSTTPLASEQLLSPLQKNALFEALQKEKQAEEVYLFVLRH